MIRWSLDFAARFDYQAYDEITVNVDLVCGGSSATVDPTLDTGSKFCIFQPSYARWLGLNLREGIPERIRTATGSFTAYGHEVRLMIGDLAWSATVYFAEPEEFPINVVGRIGFLDHLQIGLIDYEQLLYLGPYETA